MKLLLTAWCYRMGYRRCLIAARSLSTLEPPEWPEGLLVAPFGPEDAAPLRALGAEGLDEFAQRMARGDRPWGLWEGDTLVCFGWSTRAVTDFNGLWALRPGSGEVYLYNFFTHPAHRGRGLYPLLLRAIGAQLAQEGATRAWIAVASYNQASWRGILKAGFRPVAVYRAATAHWGRLSVLPGQPAPHVRPCRSGLLVALRKPIPAKS